MYDERLARVEDRLSEVGTPLAVVRGGDSGDPHQHIDLAASQQLKVRRGIRGAHVHDLACVVEYGSSDCCAELDLEARDGAVGLRVAERSEFVVDAAPQFVAVYHVVERLPPGSGRGCRIKVVGGRATDPRAEPPRVSSPGVTSQPSLGAPSCCYRSDTQRHIIDSEDDRCESRAANVWRPIWTPWRADRGVARSRRLHRDRRHGSRSRRTLLPGRGQSARVDPPRRAFLYLIGSHVGFWPGVVILYAPAPFEPEWRNGSAADL